MVYSAVNFNVGGGMILLVAYNIEPPINELCRG